MKIISKIILLTCFIIGCYVIIFIDYRVVYQPFLLPSETHFLGTNSYGLDIFNIIFASSINFFLMCMFGYISFFMGILIGSVQGYFKGKADFILQRIYEIIISIPYFYIIILFTGYFELNIFNLGIILILFNWTFLIPQVRVQALKVSQLSFITSMENIGYTKWRIFFIHLIPNVYNNVKYLVPFVLILFISSLSALDFLGFSFSSSISVGGMIFEGINYLDFPFILLSSVGFMSIFFISLIVLFDVNKYYGEG